MEYKEQKLNIRSGVLRKGDDRMKAFSQVFWVVLFSVLYLLRDLSNVSFSDSVFTAICGVAFLVTDIGTSLGIFMFASALIVPLVEIRTVYVCVLLVKLVLSGKTKMHSGMLLATMGMLLLQLVNMLLFATDSLFAQIYDFFVRMLFLCMPIFWPGAEFSAKDYQRALMCYVAGVMLGGTITLILTADKVTWQVLLSGEANARLGATENVEGTMQTTYNANQLAGMFAIAAAIIVGAMDQKRMPKLLAFPLLGYSMFMVVMTRSRTGILMMILIVLVYYWVTAFRRKKFWSGTFMLAAIVLVVVFVLNMFPGAVDAFMDRFTDQEDITSGRSDLFVRYLEAWIADPWCIFFGYGIGTYGNVVDIWEVPHNAITDTLISWGLLGLILVLVTLFLHYKKGIRNVKKEMWALAMLPVIAAVFSCMAGQYLTTGFPHMRLCFLLLATKAFEQAETEQTKASETK